MPQQKGSWLRGAMSPSAGFRRVEQKARVVPSRVFLKNPEKEKPFKNVTGICVKDFYHASYITTLAVFENQSDRGHRRPAIGS